MLALIEGPARHWPAWTLASAMLAVAALALFVRACRIGGGGAPLVDMTLLTQPRFATGCLLVLLVFSTAAALFLCYALLMQTGLGVDALSHLRAGQRGLRGRLDAGAATGGALRHAGHRAGRAAHGGATAALMLQVGAAGGALSPWSLVPVLARRGAGRGHTPLVNRRWAWCRTIRPAWPPAWCRRCNRWARRWAAAAGMLFSARWRPGWRGGRRPLAHRPSPAR